MGFNDELEAEKARLQEEIRQQELETDRLYDERLTKTRELLIILQEAFGEGRITFAMDEVLETDDNQNGEPGSWVLDSKHSPNRILGYVIIEAGIAKFEAENFLDVVFDERGKFPDTLKRKLIEKIAQEEVVQNS